MGDVLQCTHHSGGGGSRKRFASGAMIMLATELPSTNGGRGVQSTPTPGHDPQKRAHEDKMQFQTLPNLTTPSHTLWRDDWRPRGSPADYIPPYNRFVERSGERYGSKSGSRVSAASGQAGAAARAPLPSSPRKPMGSRNPIYEKPPCTNQMVCPPPCHTRDAGRGW